MKLNFMQQAFVLPGGVLDVAHEADEVQLRVLLWLASDLALCEKPSQLARLAGTDVKSVRSALSFWKKAGVLIREEEKEEAVPTSKKSPRAPKKREEDEEKPAVAVLSRAVELPNYTTSELAEILEGRESFRLLLTEAQNIIGRVFNTADTNVMVGLYDNLGFSEEYILRFLAHCRRMEKKSMRLIEQYAISLADRGICTPEALEEEIRTAEALHSKEGEIRRLFGLGARSLTGKETKYLRNWMEWGYDIEAVTLAYEATVNATGKPSLPYANSILTRWHELGWSTPEEIRAGVDAEKEKKQGKTEAISVLGSSFDTDALLEAALSRGFSERRED